MNRRTGLWGLNGKVGAARNRQWITWVANGLTVGEFGAAFTCSTPLCEIYRHPLLPDIGSLEPRYMAEGSEHQMDYSPPLTPLGGLHMCDTPV